MNLKQLNIKTILISLSTFLISTISFSQDFTIAHISYQIPSFTNSTVQIINNPRGVITGDLIIPNTVGNNGVYYSVTSIANAAFFDNEIASVTIPKSVTTIGKCAFSNHQIVTTSIPETVNIESNAIANNNQLELFIPKQKLMTAV